MSSDDNGDLFFGLALGLIVAFIILGILIAVLIHMEYLDSHNCLSDHYVTKTSGLLHNIVINGHSFKDLGCK